MVHSALCQRACLLICQVVVNDRLLQMIKDPAIQEIRVLPRAGVLRVSRVLQGARVLQVI